MMRYCDNKKILAGWCAAVIGAIGIAAGSIATAAETDSAGKSSAFYSDIAKVFAESLPALHLESLAMDDAIAERAMRLYINLMDGDHSFFLASDVASFKTREHSIDDMLRNGDTSFANEAVSVLLKRVEERCDYVDKILKEGVKVDTSDELIRDRKNTPWPANAGEQNELWKRKIKDEYIRFIVGTELRVKRSDGKKSDGKKKEEAPVEAQTNTVVKAPTAEESISKRYRQFLTVLKDMDQDTIFQQYVSSFARAYDPHSDYMSASVSEDFDISMKLSLVGIGALLSSEDGAAKIVRVMPGGAAAQDGRLKAGDKIIAVGEGNVEPVDILHWPLSKTVRLIRGKKGTKVVLIIIPASDPTGSTTARIELTRDDVKLEESEAKGSTREVKRKKGPALKLGVVSLPSFYADIKAMTDRSQQEYKSSSRDVRRILRDMEKEKVSGMVLDLRNNGGGSLPEAVEMSGLFIKAGPVVQVKDKRNVTVLQDQDSGVVYGGPLVVLVDRLSASASEILAGALQDYGRAVIVGDTRTHGKGTVQSVVGLRTTRPDWGSMKITTASFYRFTGKSTQRDGVSSDIVVSSPLEMLDVGEEFLEYSLPSSRIDPVDMRQEETRAFIDNFLFAPRKKLEYQPVGDIRLLVDSLRRKSEERRKGDPRFAARESLLKSFAARQRKATVSLNLAERRKEAEEELRLDELQKLNEDAAEGAEGEKKTDSGSDLVLEEALNILADMVSTESAAAEQ